MNASAGERYSGLDRYEARNLVVADLEELGLLEKVETHHHRVPTCERCHTTIEPLLSDQWFMTMAGTDVVRGAVNIVERDDIQFAPARYKKIYLDWMASLRDWPLSRQLWWGHRIPVYYKPDGTFCRRAHVGRSRPAGGHRPTHARPGRSGHVVFQCAVAVCDARLACTDHRFRLLLPHRRAHHVTRNPVPVGGADGDDGHGVYGTETL